MTAQVVVFLDVDNTVERVGDLLEFDTGELLGTATKEKS